MQSNGFEVHIDTQYSLISSICNQTFMEFEQITMDLRRVLSYHVSLITAGIILEHICQLFINLIFQLNDIGDEESKRLAKVLNLERMTKLFIVNDKLMTFKYCGTALQKLQLLRQILTWSFAAIMEHFRLGALIDFTTNELIKLCKALFSDTPLRLANIRELESGHPL